MMRLDSICGNRRLKAQLSEAFESGKLAQTLVLSGPARAGKKTIARLCAAAYLCTADETGALSRPCLHCAACRRVMQDLHPDVTVIDRGDEEIRVDDARTVRERAQESSVEGGHRIFILCHAENMNASAQNALLKVLEEPLEQVHFFLLSENPAGLLPTVRSRCLHLTVEPVQESEMLPWLASAYPERDSGELREAVRLSQGSIGQAMRLLDEQTEEAEGAALAEKLLQTLQSGDELAVWQCIQEQEKPTRDLLRSFFGVLRMTVRDGLVIQAGMPQLAMTRQGELAAALSPALLLHIADLTEAYLTLTEQNVGPSMLTGAFCCALFHNTEGAGSGA